MKSGSQLPGVVTAIQDHADPTRSAMVQNCGLPGEQVFSDLEDINPEKLKGYFATVIVKE